MQTGDERNMRPGHEALSDLFVLVGDYELGRGHGPVSTPWVAFDDVLERLSLSANCYFAPAGGRVPDPALTGRIERLCAYLFEHPFCQINLRPIHSAPLDSEGMAGLTGFYRSLFGMVRTFQEEGFRNQIVPRLRIFPILWFSTVSRIRMAGPVLQLLQENFFLPSLYLSPAQVQEWESLFGSTEGTGPFERIYVGMSREMKQNKILEDLFVTCSIERFLSADMMRSLKAIPSTPCANMLYLASDRSNRSCPKGSPSYEDALGSEACSDCLRSGLSAASTSFRLNGRTQEFGLLCDRIGSWLFDIGDRKGALEALRKGTEKCPGREISNEVLLKRAFCHYENGELEAAMECLRSALARDSESAEIRYQMGLCEYGWKDYIESADRFEEALRLGLSGALKTEAEYMKGLSHYHIEEYEEAIDALEKAVSGGKRDSPVFFYLGLAWLGRGDAEKALRYLLEALSLDPSEEDLFHVLFYVAHAHKELGRYEECLEFLKRAESMGQSRKEVMNLAGFCLFKLGRYDEAIRCFRTCLEIDPRSAIDWANIGSCLRDKGDRRAAVEMYRKALSLDPGIEFARESLTRLESEGSL